MGYLYNILNAKAFKMRRKYESIMKPMREYRVGNTKTAVYNNVHGGDKK